MTNSDSLNASRTRYRVGNSEYVRYGPRDWRYAEDEEIQVPGGRDMRLDERFEPIIGARGGEKQVVIIDGADVERAPDALGWSLSVGIPARGDAGELIQVIVPFAAWEEHNEIIDVMVAPELDEDEHVRELALREVEVKKAERRLAEEKRERDALLIRLAAAGMTRQRAAEITGMSVGKVQQIIKSVDVAKDEKVLIEILRKHGPLSAAKLADRAKGTNQTALGGSKSKLKKVLGSLKAQGLVRSDPSEGWSVTPQGSQALEQLGCDNTAFSLGKLAEAGLSDSDHQEPAAG
jgi:ribosomal protein S19E (S16A)